MQSILTVWTGNICRGPMAEGLLRHRLASRQDVTVASAGVEALVAHPADPIAVEIMRQRGIDISAHRGRQISESMLRAHGLVFATFAHEKAGRGFDARRLRRREPVAYESENVNELPGSGANGPAAVVR